MVTNQVRLASIDLYVWRVRGAPQNFLVDIHVKLLIKGEVRTDQFTASTAKVVEVVQRILANVNLPIWVGDLINRP